MTESVQNPIRILLVDDHQSFLWGLVKLIESDGPGMKVIGTASDMPAALAIVEREQPDIILLDIDLHGVNSLDSMSLLLQLTKAPVLILTGVRDTETRDRAMLSGARGIVQKEESAEAILKAIQSVHKGEIWLDRASTGRIFSKLLNPLNGETSPETAKIGSLTVREREIIDVIIRHGRSTNKEIAAHLNMSEHTLRNHLTSIYSKLEVENRLELVMYALKHDLGKSNS
ncbi:MAG TPA: response regulator transcription factor [Pyrinomonadaceae bacterium]|jgi:two-component system, NarL family, nitrate/nitrite response regulator NarL|nr:response regulator transcription factor [Pyrinomonadaceae bacterium]